MRTTWPTTRRIPWSGVSCVCAAVVELLLAGCAARRPLSMADRFIRQGEPTVHYGSAPPQTSTAEYVAQLRELSRQARPRAKSVNPELTEAQDTRLRDALAVLAAAPTATAHYAVALEYRRIGIADAAFSHASSAIRIDAKHAAAYDLRARLWRSWGLPRLGLTDARRALVLAPQSATAWNTYGLLLEGGGDTKMAIRAYLRAVRYDGHAGYAWNNLCRAWTSVGEPAAAVSACRRTIDLEPTLVEAQMTLVEAERLLPRSAGHDKPRTQPMLAAASGASDAASAADAVDTAAALELRR